jgi:23S rRNA (cytidine1920-2'-O)/16S rRNA (cytidine1409-2'-O)-methyltransferase
MAEKKRIDIYLLESGMTESREKAKALVVAGAVFINGRRCDKPSFILSGDEKVEMKAQEEFVSRGGKKLEKAIKTFHIDLKGVTAVDVGASTGGFTDCMLQNGAEFVYAVDVGRGQLAWKLRSDSRVKSMERVNARFLSPDMFDREIHFASIDVSFISLKLVLPAVKSILTAPYNIVALIKPQFEAGRDKVGKKGVVRDVAIHTEVIKGVLDFTRGAGFAVAGLTYSPIKGPEGNIEYLVLLRDGEEVSEISAERVVKEAHETLD